jgi:D-3-phosphoglycerate dehydrogenase
MKLAEQLGSFAGQATETAIKAVTVEYEGAVAALNIKPLTAVVLQGLLSPLLETVNMVSAPAIARERGLDVREVRHERAGAYQTLIRLTIVSETQTRAIAGTLFNDEPRIVDIKGIPIDARLGPHMIYVTNRDKPGFIGALGMLLGNANINIATFSLGREKPGGDAIALIEVDQSIDAGMVAKIRALPQVMRCKPMRF